MAATETIRIVLHAQARPGLCFPCTFQPSDRSKRSPPKVCVVHLAVAILATAAIRATGFVDPGCARRPQFCSRF
jgi:hypothetical protein